MVCASIASMSYRISPLLIRYILALVGLSALCVGFFLQLHDGSAADSCQRDNPTISLQVGSKELQVEVAADPAARECGLAFREHLSVDHGMLFVFTRADRWPFWMKDTRLPLAIAFIDDSHRIAELRKMRPEMGMQEVKPASPARFVLETHFDWFEKHNLGLGDSVSFELPRQLEIR